jgi:magnesium transporter
MPQKPEDDKKVPEVTPSDRLAAEAAMRSGEEAARFLANVSPETRVQVLQSMNPAVAQRVMDELTDADREAVLAAASPLQRRQWMRNEVYPEDSVGRLMETPTSVFDPALTVGQAIEQVRELSHKVLVTYGYIVEGTRLIGIVTMRDLLLSERSTPLLQVTLRDPFFLTPSMSLTDAMRSVVTRHYPVYPVCEPDGTLVGLVRGQALFEAQAFEISAQAGRMVGIDKEERLSTPWARSLRFRHPWLQLNLLTAFVAAAVVGMFQGTIDRLVILATFLPVLAGQSGNTGCQALAVALRGMTLGELKAGQERALVTKEALLGLMNGALVGVTAGLGMFLAASAQHNPDALLLAFIVFLAMIGSCVVSGLSGALIPLTLRRFGADPATASSIFLTTATDVASMGLFLSLAALLVR